MALQKAAIMVTRGNKQTERIDVLFNPTEYTIETSNEFSWDTVPGLSQPIAYFISGNVPSLTMDLFFDSYEKGTDVRTHTQKVAKLLDVDKDLHAPPLCKFVWGSLQFKGVVEQVTQKYTMFLDSGIPVRATLTVTFKAVASVKEQYQNIPRQSADRTKQKTVKQGDALWRIAAEEYEDPGLWREIAKANRIDDPTRLEPGSVLKIPRLH
jgi:LysM repeat protein